MRNSDGSTEPKVLEMLPKLNVRVVDRSPEHLESPSTLPTKMRDWLNNEATGFSNNASSPNFRLYTKLLVSNAAAGSIIGKAGGNINEFQAKTYSRIQLSKSGEYYPGTTERTLLVSGGLKQIIAALGLIFAKLQREGVAPVTPRTKSAMEDQESPIEEPEPAVSPSHPVHLAIKLLVPQPLCGIIIGKMGSTVKAYAMDTHTQIRVTAPDGPAVGLNHRIVTINGSTDNCLKAIALLILKQTEDPKFQMYSELPSSYSSAPTAGGIAIPGGAYTGSPYVLTPQSVHAMQHMGYQSYMTGNTANAAGGMTSAGTSPPTSAMYAAAGTNAGGHAMYTNAMDGLATMTFPLPDDQATVVVGQGRGSGGIEDVQAAAGVRIKVELGGEKGTPATQHQPNIAHITVIGSPENVQYANFLMAQRLSSLMMMMHQQHQQYAMAANHANGTTYYHHQHSHSHHTYGRPQSHMYGNGNSTSGGYHQYNGGGGTGGMENENGGRRPSPRTVMAAHVRGSNNGSLVGGGER